MKNKLCILSLILVISLALSPSRTWVVEGAKADYKPTTLLHYSTDEVKSYVKKMSVKYGVNPTISLWIVDKESGNGQRMVGPEPNGTVSYGYWQFNNKNDGFNYDCSMDLKCSTQLAMNWILQGKVNKWTTWSMRHVWYEGAPD